MDRTPFHGLLYVAAGMYVQNKINTLLPEQKTLS